MLLLVLICGWAIDAYGQRSDEIIGRWSGQRNSDGTAINVLCPTGRCPVSGTCPPQAKQGWQFPVKIQSPLKINRQDRHPAICRVHVDRGNGWEVMRESGTGTLIWRGPNKAVVLTVQHIFRKRGGRTWVEFPNGERYNAESVYSEENPDLGAVIIPRPDIEPIKISQDDPAVPGDVVILHGYSGQKGLYNKMPSRVVGYTTHQLPDGSFSKRNDLVITGVADDGNSGGPILNSKGELIAVVWGGGGRDPTSLGTYTGGIGVFLTSQKFKPPWGTDKLTPWNARTEQEKIRADAGAYAPAQRQPMVPVAPAVTAAGMDMVARQMAQDALSQVGSLSARVDAAHKEATGAIAATKSVAEKADEATAGLAVLEKGLAERIFSGVKAYTFGLLKSWGLPGGIVMTGVIAIGFFFVRKKLNRVAQIIDWITDKIPGQWDDKLIDPLVYKAASLVSGKPIPDYAHDPGFDAFGRPIPGYQAPVPVQPVAPPAAAVVPPPQPTAKEVALQTQVDVLTAAAKG